MKLVSKQEFETKALTSLSSMYDALDNLEVLQLSSLNANKTVIFSVDLNNGFAKEGAMCSPRIYDLIEDTVTLFKKAQQIGIKMFAYTDSHSKDALEFKSYPVHCLKEEEESKVVDEIKPYLHQVIGKESTNGFHAKNPLELVNSEVDTFIVTGDCTDICIYQFALTLVTYLNQIKRQARVIVPLNVVDTFDTTGHDSDLYNVVFVHSMINNGIVVVKEIV